MIEVATGADRPAIARLIELCNQHEGIELPVEVDGEGFVWRDKGEVVGFAELEGRREIELSGMVHPKYRQRGMGTALLDAARMECRRRGTESLSLVIDEASPSGHAFAYATGGTYDISEYRMLLDRDEIAAPPKRKEVLALTQIDSTERALFASLSAVAFDEPLERNEAWLEHDMVESNRRFWVARRGEEPVGTVRAIAIPPRVYITALGVVPACRGRGYGREILLRTVDMLGKEGWPEILLEVETDNINALRLYRSSGFRVTRTYGFYRLSV